MVKRILSLIILLFSISLLNSSFLLTGNISSERSIKTNGKLSELLPAATEYALLIGSDGTAALISSRSLSFIEIKNERNISYSYSEILPPVCNIKHLKEICVYRSFYDSSRISPFTKAIQKFKLLGESKKNGHFAFKFKLR